MEEAQALQSRIHLGGPVTKAELSQLIIVIYASERRADAPSKAVVEAWHPQLVGYSFEDCLRVVSQHYAESDRPITLAQLCAGARKQLAARKPPERIEDRLRVPEADPDDPGAFIRAMREQRYFAIRNPEDFVVRELDLPSMGEVPEDRKEEETAPKPRPRRWWLLRGKGTDGSDE